MVKDGVSLAGVMDTVLFFIQLVFHARQVSTSLFPKNSEKIDQIQHASTQTINDRNAITAHDNISIGSSTDSMDSVSNYSYGSVQTQTSTGSTQYIPEGSDTEQLIHEEGSIDSFVNNYSNHVKNASVSSNEHTIYIQVANTDEIGDYYDLQIVTATSGNYSGRNRPITGDSITAASDGNRPGSLIFRYRPDEDGVWKLQSWKESGVMKRSEIMAAVKIRDFENFSDEEIEDIYEQLAALHLSRRVASKSSEVIHTSVTATYTESKSMQYLHDLISKSRMRYNYGLPNYSGKDVINGIKSLLMGGSYPGPWCPKSSYQTYINQMSDLYN